LKFSLVGDALKFRPIPVVQGIKVTIRVIDCGCCGTFCFRHIYQIKHIPYVAERYVAIIIDIGLKFGNLTQTIQQGPVVGLQSFPRIAGVEMDYLYSVLERRTLIIGANEYVIASPLHVNRILGYKLDGNKLALDVRLAGGYTPNVNELAEEMVRSKSEDFKRTCVAT
jgi:hypothetical protein